MGGLRVFRIINVEAFRSTTLSRFLCPSNAAECPSTPHVVLFCFLSDRMYTVGDSQDPTSLSKDSLNAFVANPYATERFSVLHLNLMNSNALESLWQDTQDKAFFFVENATARGSELPEQLLPEFADTFRLVLVPTNNGSSTVYSGSRTSSGGTNFGEEAYRVRVHHKNYCTKCTR